MQAQTQRKVRQFHHYLGVFFAPAIIFFAVSGALQTFRLQEVKGWGGPPPTWIVWIASIHRDQGPPKVKLPRPPEVRKAPPADAGVAAPKPKSKLPLQIFTVVMSVGLVFSSLLGIVIALNNRAMRRVSLVMLVAGSLVPLLMV